MNMSNNSLSNIRKEFISYFVKNNHTHVKSSSLIPHNDNTLLFTNAGMVQFKNTFLGLEQRDYNRVVSVQKCLRAGGKHNDLDNVGYTSRHQTFFEMLGNFSFGDYFKELAIFYAFEFITKTLGISKSKLIVTVYSEDVEAYKLWQKIAGFSSDKIIKIDTSDNFWSMGDTGPSGPCTEIFYDLGDAVKGGPPGSKYADGDRFTEIWNLVFMQYNQLKSGKKELLNTPSVDTGMGLERIASVMQGVLDNYDIDLFKTIINATQDLLKVKVTLENKASFKIIADHIRASAFLISDGVLPSNEGRGYVLRRIIRRAIRHGYLLGNKEPIFYKLIPLVTQLMGSTYSELTCSTHLASTTVYSEEEKFNKTIDDGMKLLLKSKDFIKNNLFPGDIAFKLYDTYGFPLDLTESILKQYNVLVDINQFSKCMDKQKNLSKQNWVGSGEIKDNEFWFKLNEYTDTDFIGYDKLNYETNILDIVSTSYTFKNSVSSKDEAFLLFDKTTFYPEGGGQVGDKGIIFCLDPNVSLNDLKKELFSDLWHFYYQVQNSSSGNDLYLTISKINKVFLESIKAQVTFFAEVIDTVKVANSLIVHKVNVIYGEVNKNSNCILMVNPKLRKQCAANHTATHILYASLKKVLGYEVMQQSSFVSHNRLRSDVFLSKPLTKEQTIAIESVATQIITSNIPVSINFMSYKEAVNKGVRFLMGENYPDIVRVVTIGTSDQVISRELCCGCHVNNTGEIGIFKILSETGIKSGVRRLEVATGQNALSAFQALESDMNLIYNHLKANKANVVTKVSNLLSINKELSKKLDDFEILSLVHKAEQNIQQFCDFNYIKLVVNNSMFGKVRNVANSIVNKYKPVIFFVISDSIDTVSYLLSISTDLSNKINLQNFIKELQNHAKEAKGGGNNFCVQGSVNINNKTLLENTVNKLITTVSSS